LELVTDAFSKAIYSTWLFSKPLRTLFDAGEGLVSALRNRSFAIERVFITHGHYDHIGGLPGLVRIRGQGRGDKEKPLAIYYPEGDSGCELLQAYIARLVPNPSFHLEWVPVRDGTQIEISEKGKRKYVEAFPVEHMSRRLCLGFNVCETRERLKREYASMDEKEIASLARKNGRETLTETYEKRVLSFCGDGLAVEPDRVMETDLLIHEATFLDDGERGKEIHSTVSEAVAAAKAARTSELLLLHFSTRYRASDIFKALRTEVRKAGIEIPVHALLGGRISALETDRNVKEEHEG
jgi:ribonuclease Z